MHQPLSLRQIPVLKTLPKALTIVFSISVFFRRPSNFFLEQKPITSPFIGCLSDFVFGGSHARGFDIAAKVPWCLSVMRLETGATVEVHEA